MGVKVRLPDSGMKSVDLRGRRYNADRRGEIELPSREQADVVRRAFGEGAITTGFAGARSVTCPGCGSERFAFSKVCARCGAILRTDA